MTMYKRTLTLILFASFIFFTTASYAKDKSLEVLQEQLTEVQSRIKILQEENRDLRKRLASNEKEIAGYRARLEKIEAEIAALEEE